MKQVKPITVDQLKPGMFIVELDLPWYRTPFLLHKRLIHHTEEIDQLRQLGVRELKIDPTQGLDVEPDPSLATSTTSNRQKPDPANPLKQQARPASTEQAPQPHRFEENGAPQQQPATRDDALPPRTRELAAAAQETYREAISSMEHMFDELETGVVPRPETARIVVENILSRVLDDSASMLSVLTLQKMKRFDRTLASHALDVCTLSLIVAQAYGIEEREMESLGAGALLHDIGYVRLPRNLYRRSHDLTGQEQLIMRQHPTLGLAILRDVQESRDTVVRIVMEHHEHRNGNGFPHNLTGDSLSVLAELVGLIDVYDSMVSRRGGRPAMLPHDAIRQLFRLGDAGQYTMDVIQAMIGCLGVYPIGSLVLLNTGEQAVVVGINHTKRIKPVVQVITGTQGGSYLTPIRIDLGAQAIEASVRTITKVLNPLDEHVNVALFLDGVHEQAA